VVGEGPREDWFDESDVRSQAPLVPHSIPLRGEQQPQSSLADNPLTKLWQNAEEEAGGTGADAIESIRARRREQGPEADKKGARWRRRHGEPEPPGRPQHA
jgi:hypothetical protein